MGCGEGHRAGASANRSQRELPGSKRPFLTLLAACLGDNLVYGQASIRQIDIRDLQTV
jgi:hypothetical protein